MFHIEGRRFPFWIQEAEWPVSATGKPMKFISQKSVYQVEVKQYIFEDVDTHEQVIVEQFY